MPPHLIPTLLLKWYFISAPQGLLRLATNLSLYLEDMFGLKLTLKNFLTPMWHDTTWVGRGISLVIRFLWLFGGGLTWSLITTFAYLAIPFWFLGHALIFIDFFLWITWLTALAILFGLRLTIYDDPWNQLPSEFYPQHTLLAMPGHLRNAINQYPNLSRLNHALAIWWQRLNIYPLPSTALNKEDHSRNHLLKLIHQIATKESSDQIDSRHVILALTQIDPRIQAQLKAKNINSQLVEQIGHWIDNQQKWWATYPLWSPRYTIPQLSGVNRALTGVVTPTLDSFSVDLTKIVSRLPEAVDREKAYDQLFKTLSRTGRHALVIGEPGCGKTTFVGGLAQMVMRGNAPQVIAQKRLVKLEPGLIIAGTKSQGELTRRMTDLLDEIRFSEDIILFIDEIHTLLTAQETAEGLNLYSVMEPLLTDPAVNIIGATNIGNYRKFIEPNAAFSKMFDLVKLDQVEESDLYTIIQNVIAEIETHHQIIFTIQAVEAAIKLSYRYIHDRVLPDKAIDLLEKAAVLAKEQDSVTLIQASGKPRGLNPLNSTNKSRTPGVNSQTPQPLVLPTHIAQVVSQTTGVPVTQIGKEERAKLLKLEELIHQAYVNQDQAVDLVSDALRRARLDIREASRPIGSFLFVGPTGVGKTELARRLAEIYFGTHTAIVRLDMSEYSHPDMISRLIGAAPGTGSREAGQLTEPVRRQPFALILLDEIEKAHHSTWDLFLQVMDEGHLTDSLGRTIDFKNTILISTSNAVTLFITQQLNAGRALEDINKQIFTELQKTFHTEFLNRFDGIVPFRPLAESEMITIAQLQLDNLAKRLKAKNITVKYSKELPNKLAQLGTSKTLGARPLKRLIQDRLESHLAKVLLEQPPDQQTTITLSPALLD
jgi:ATP-dependent Clp protease ATP-binding subunit ClpC